MILALPPLMGEYSFHTTLIKFYSLTRRMKCYHLFGPYYYSLARRKRQKKEEEKSEHLIDTQSEVLCAHGSRYSIYWKMLFIRNESDT